MAAAKKSRADSAASAVTAMLNASKATVQPPEHCTMRNGDEPFWVGVIHARTVDEWTEADLVVAAQLARCQHDIESQQITLDLEGCVVVNDRGTQIMNPRVSVLEQLARREMALMRTLRIGGSVSGDTRDAVGKRKIEQSSRKLRHELEAGNGLLA
jgi:hypothetical protein